jgi:hypothetical protein
MWPLQASNLVEYVVMFPLFQAELFKPHLNATLSFCSVPTLDLICFGVSSWQCCWLTSYGLRSIFKHQKTLVTQWNRKQEDLRTLFGARAAHAVHVVRQDML